MARAAQSPETLPDAFYSRFHDVLRQRRLGVGDLASKLGVEPGHLGRVINRRRPGSALLFKALELTLGEENWAWCMDRGKKPKALGGDVS